MSMSKKLYVSNLPFEIDNAALEEIFSSIGKVESANIIIDRDSGRSKGFGFVEMSTVEEAREAIEKLNGSSHSERPINVTEARPQVPRDNNRGGGYGGGNGGRGGYGPRSN